MNLKGRTSSATRLRGRGRSATKFNLDLDKGGWIVFRMKAASGPEKHGLWIDIHSRGVAMARLTHNYRTLCLGWTTAVGSQPPSIPNPLPPALPSHAEAKG